MILRISVNLVKFCVSEVGEFWRSFSLLGLPKEGLRMVSLPELEGFINNFKIISMVFWPKLLYKTNFPYRLYCHHDWIDR
jgi:hypothetical protein